MQSIALKSGMNNRSLNLKNSANMSHWNTNSLTVEGLENRTLLSVTAAQTVGGLSPFSPGRGKQKREARDRAGG